MWVFGKRENACIEVEPGKFAIEITASRARFRGSSGGLEVFALPRSLLRFRRTGLFRRLPCAIAFEVAQAYLATRSGEKRYPIPKCV